MIPVPAGLYRVLIQGALIVAAVLGVYAGYRYVTTLQELVVSTREARQQAEARLESAREEARRNESLLAAREAQLAKDRLTIARQHRRIQELSIEDCDLDAARPELDNSLLPDGAALQPHDNGAPAHGPGPADGS